VLSARDISRKVGGLKPFTEIRNIGCMGLTHTVEMIEFTFLSWLDSNDAMGFQYLSWMSLKFWGTGHSCHVKRVETTAFHVSKYVTRL
jgi:hypothetical protein